MKAGYWAALSAAALLLAAAFEALLTRSMSLHMLLHIPLILLSGILAACAVAAGRVGAAIRVSGLRAHYAKYNEYGIAGLLLCSFVAAYWMIPRSLDQVLVSAPANGLKYLGLFIAGMALCDSLRRANSVIILFFLGNFSWMTAIAGLLYQDNPQRLCNFYLLGDQEIAGRGLVAVAVLVPVAWLLAERRRIRRFLQQ
ncbi:hypothetical protein [Pollutimonas sp. M17]|uniref:hypothetical protein n=1 Tax=Pollutimonas sp. M17 TaxID=2962065 RepID=UPI0021F4F0BF|nr:hypothetical protein [Pollutimonas sp. M17]UYO93070.1 hypothetical protein OEG81_14420 [Pollutimonas sp. M17]